MDSIIILTKPRELAPRFPDKIGAGACPGVNTYRGPFGDLFSIFWSFKLIKMKKLKTLIVTAASLMVLTGNAFAAKLDEGINLFKSEEFEKAIAVFEQISRDEPENADVHLWLSRCYEKTFQLDKSIQETKAYNTIKYKHTNDPVVENTPVQPEPELKTDPMKLIYLNDDYVDKVIGSRNQEAEIKNQKFLDFKAVKKVLTGIPTDSDSLIKLNRIYEIKSHYGIASHEDLIVLNKTRAELISFDIDTKKFELAQETNEARKKNIEYDLKKLVKSHNNSVEKAGELINQPVYENTDPLSYEYFKVLETEPGQYIKDLEQKKANFRIAIEEATKSIKIYTKLIIPQEKDLKAKKAQISPDLLSSQVNTLTGSDKEIVMNYNNLEDKINSNKKNLLNFIAEQGILIESFNKINETIKKINPDYVINDAPLPKQEKLQEMK
jgi:hypothetical protein